MYCLCRHAPNWLWNTDSQKKLKTKFHGKFSKIYFFDFFLVKFFLVKFFHEIAERSVAISECT
jgi:hypothetical protein